MNRFYHLRLPNLLFLLSLLSSLLILSFGWLFGTKAFNISSPSMRQAVAQLSKETMLGAMEREIPYLRFREVDPTAARKPYALFAFETLTGLHPTDLRSLLGRELPGLAAYKTEALSIGANVDLEHYVVESAPPLEITQLELANQREAEAAAEEKKQAAVAAQARQVFIYNTHNTESWTHVTTNKGVVDKDKNVTLISERLGEELKKRGIQTIVDTTDHQQILEEQGLAYALSYAVSLKAAKAAMAENEQISYVFDIHRDSKRKDKTTTVINGKAYARPFFVIGKRNPLWEQNAELANQFHHLLEQKYPGLSIGVFAKGEGHGEYNQSISPNSLLIEVGGIDNTLEEVYNTSAALADVFADIYFEKDQKVDAPTDSSENTL
ncbi:hypothetical protein BEP19_16655 [Ammoniphilus oxalaticus]|uniref:Stage II sporulation protein P n=1 Tax=Ammoniphilus oxalaticus TaxID=66863 RepID=A0A419SQS7_9BACL|nr:stage II sporulation protein P [Ammoniphilus oxalaticus]RKD26823.1 hypothetical protein BEP19_16655 [Ammoniphilus oxalaticus]